MRWNTIAIFLGAIITLFLAILAERLGCWVKAIFWAGLVLAVFVLTIIQIVDKKKTEKQEVEKDRETQQWQTQIFGKLEDLQKQAVSASQQRSIVDLKRQVATSPRASSIPPSLKTLFLTDFGAHLNRARLDDRTLTVGSRSGKFPEETMTFTAQLWIDMHESTQFLGIYIPRQDKNDPTEGSRKTVLLCQYLPGKFPELIKQLQSLVVSMPNSTGSMVVSSDLPFSRRIYIYHEDFISPPDLGVLVKQYESLQFLVEFRGSDYLAKQQLESALRDKVH